MEIEIHVVDRSVVAIAVDEEEPLAADTLDRDAYIGCVRWLQGDGLSDASVYSIARIGQVQIMYRARLASPDFAAGPESAEVRLSSWDEIPWDEIAFRTVREALRLYFEDRAKGSFGRVHTVDII